MVFNTESCPDCDGPGILGGGDGKCSRCHGSGLEVDVITALAEAISGQSQKCETCGGSGKCQTCYGKGYLNT